MPVHECGCEELPSRVVNDCFFAYAVLAVADHGYTPAGDSHVDIFLQFMRADVYERGI